MAVKIQMLADSSRLAILQSDTGERNVAQIVEDSGKNQANVSKHLKILNETGLAALRKEGFPVFYRVGGPLVERLCKFPPTRHPPCRRPVPAIVRYLGPSGFDRGVHFFQQVRGAAPPHG